MSGEDPAEIIGEGILLSVRCENKRIITIRRQDGKVEELEIEINSFVEDLLKQYIGKEVLVLRDGDIKEPREA